MRLCRVRKSQEIPLSGLMDSLKSCILFPQNPALAMFIASGSGKSIHISNVD